MNQQVDSSVRSAVCSTPQSSTRRVESSRVPRGGMWLGVLLVILWSSLSAQAQIQRGFAPRFSANDTGDIQIIGNTLFTCPASTTCTNALNGNGSSLNNNNFRMVNVNVAGGTTNASSANLAIPPGASVLWAGLYWGARPPSGSPCALGTACSNVRFATPTSGGYRTLRATQIDLFSGSGSAYQGFVEVTIDVRAGGSGTYRVADVAALTGSNNYAGWALVVVLRDPTQMLRNLTVFDGFAQVGAGMPVTTTVQGFLTPLAGAFTTRIGTVVYEGDLGFPGDTFQINGVRLGNTANPASNFFNSSISSAVTTLPPRNPQLLNQLGFDIDVLDASGTLPNGASSATITFTTNEDQYFPGVLTFANDVFQPVIEGNVFKDVTDLNGGALNPGDILEYTITLANTGNDSTIEQTLNDPIPFNTTYVPNSLRILSGPNVGPLSDQTGDDQAEFTGAAVVFRLGTGADATMGGSIAPGAATALKFQVRINPEAPANTVIPNQATTTYKGALLGTPFSTRSDGDRTTPGAQPTIVTTGPARAMLSLAKSATPNPVVGGQNLTYQLTVTNAGPSNARTVEVSDTTPDNTTFQSVTVPAGWNVTTPSVGSAGLLTFTHTDFPPGMAVLTFVVRVAANVPNGTTIVNTAAITSPTDPGLPPPPQAGTSTLVVGAQDLVLGKNAASVTGRGQDITYTITVLNPGPNNAATVNVTDVLPGTLTFRSATAPTGWSVLDPGVGNNGTVQFTHPNLPPGTYALTLVARVDLNAGVNQTILNTATVSSATPEPDITNNTATAATTVSGPGVSKQFTPNAIVPGGTPC